MVTEPIRADRVVLVQPIPEVRESYLEASAEMRLAEGPNTAWTGNRVVPGESLRVQPSRKANRD